MSMLNRLLKKQKDQEQPEVPVAPASPLPSWTPGPSPTDLQGERQALIALIPDVENLPARKAYADWLESNGWPEDGKRLRLEVEAAELRARLNDNYISVQDLNKKPWTVYVGREQVDVKVLSWKNGFPCTIELDWKTLDRLGTEIIRMAPIEQVSLRDEVPAVCTKTADGVKATIMSCRGVSLEGSGRYESEAVEDALTKKYRVKVSKYWGGTIQSGSVNSGAIYSRLLFPPLVSGSVMASYIRSGAAVVSSGAGWRYSFPSAGLIKSGGI